MITLFRIDERLIHGQIAVKWTRHYNIDRIIVANDHAASNQLIQNSLRMAAPQQAKTAIVSIERAIELIQDPRSMERRILVLVDNPFDALKITSVFKEISEINVGNYGRIGKEEVLRTRKRYSRNVYCNHEEIQCFLKLADSNIRLYYQVVPDEVAIDMKDLLKEEDQL